MAVKRSEAHAPGSLRLWPGGVLVALQWLIWLVLPRVVPGNTGAMIGYLGGLAGGLLIVLWWAFFSRAHWHERLGAVLLMAAALLGTRLLLHESVATAGMGVLFWMYAVPILCLAFVLWALLTRHLPDRTRRSTMVALILVACAGWGLVRTDGVTAEGSQFAFRWAPTAEERLLARGEEAPTGAAPAATLLEAAADWPGFRGPRRDGIVRGSRIATDWSTSPPVELWRRPVGPGWSSFAVHGGLIYTQEQRGEEELVSCHDAATGEPVWRHRDEARFWESQGGAGPRATPTVSGGRVYSLGATGILNALDAADGTVVWSRDAAADTGETRPYWGFSGSALVVDDLVVVAASGRLAAYDRLTGEPRWTGPGGGESYSSPHLAELGGVPQILMLNQSGATSVAPADGTVLWQHEWKGYPIVQPAVTGEGDLLISVTESTGLRRLSVAGGPDGWKVEERWTSIRLKPYFNDFVVHQGHAYGFDGSILASIDLADGSRNWKRGRYGNGQLVLLADQGLLLVVSEQGELALVEAKPDSYSELARIPALEGKTWNHPVVVGDLLLLRNGQEMAAFRLAPAAG